MRQKSLRAAAEALGHRAADHLAGDFSGTRNLFRLAVAGALLVVAGSVLAGVAVTENVSAGATNWPGIPLVQTVTNPASQVAVGESFNGVGGCTNYCETFTITTTNYRLQTISIYAGAGTGTGVGTNLTLRLFDLGIQTAPNPSPYVPGADLFNAGNGLFVSYAYQATGVLQFDFSGSDQVVLTNSHLYAFELDGVSNSSPVLWQRTVSDTYAGGAAYRNRSWINGNSARDFALAVYGSVAVNTNPAVIITNTPWVPVGIDFHGFAAPVGGINLDGANPAAGLIWSGGGLWGTTLAGGSQGAGTAFYLTPDGTNFSAFRTFTNAPDAGDPQGSLVAAGSTLYGTTTGGGSAGVGAVFASWTNGGGSLIQSFAAVSADNATNAGGASPDGCLAQAGSLLFGTAVAGGTAANGTVFSLTTSGTYATLHDFSLLDSVTGTNADGALPGGGLTRSGGTLYGTASAGGAGGAGVVFSLNTSGGSFTVLHAFAPLDAWTATNAEGAFPASALVVSNDMLYGTTPAGGTGGQGTVFALGTNGLGFSVLHQFPAVDSLTGTNADGASPGAPLALADGILYGTAAAGGGHASGTVFRVGTNGAAFAVIHAFSGLDSTTGTNLDGAQPVAGVLPVGSFLFGTTFGGGPGAVGTVFKLAIPYPAIVTNLVLQADGSRTWYFVGGPNSTNVMQGTETLTPPAWRNLSTNVADAGGAWQFTETHPTNAARFYRSYVPAN